MMTRKHAEINTKDVEVLRPEHNLGWLREKTQNLLLPKHDDRFLAVDFEKQIMCFSYTQLGLHTSMQIHFSDILGVEPLPTQEDDEVEQERIRRTSWKSSRGQKRAKARAKEQVGVCKTRAWESYLPRLGKDVQHGFILQTTVKQIELLCASHDQAKKWVAAIQAAMRLCQDNAIKACNHEVDSVQSTCRSPLRSARSELLEAGDALDPPVPSCKVPLSSVLEPGRCFVVNSSLLQI